MRVAGVTAMRRANGWTSSCAPPTARPSVVSEGEHGARRNVSARGPAVPAIPVSLSQSRRPGPAVPVWPSQPGCLKPGVAITQGHDDRRRPGVVHGRRPRVVVGRPDACDHPKWPRPARTGVSTDDIMSLPGGRRVRIVSNWMVSSRTGVDPPTHQVTIHSAGGGVRPAFLGGGVQPLPVVVVEGRRATGEPGGAPPGMVRGRGTRSAVFRRG